MTKFLFIDTETNGLPNNYHAPVSDLDNWPRLVQVAWIITDNKGNTINKEDFIIYPTDFTIPNNVSKLHGITTDKARLKGKPILPILQKLNHEISEADYIIAHNIRFDEKIIGAELYRNNIETMLFDKKRICTMEQSTNYCAISGSYGYKWPKLSELYFKLFNSKFKEVHNAAADIKATVKCFWELNKRGIIDIIYNESEILKLQLEDYCLSNGLNEVPLIAKTKAIIVFEYNCKLLPKHYNANEEFDFLKVMWPKIENPFHTYSLNNYQIEFFIMIKNEIIDEHLSDKIIINLEDKFFDDKITLFNCIAIAKANEADKFKNIVVRLYYYYLIRYKEFLPSGRKPNNFNIN